MSHYSEKTSFFALYNILYSEMTSLRSSFHYKILKSKVILFTKKKNNDLALTDWPAVPPVNRWVQILHCVAHLAKFKLKSHTSNVWKACRDTAHSVSRYFSYLVLFGSLSRTDGSSGTESQQSPDPAHLTALSFNSNGDQTPLDWVCWPLCTSHIHTHTQLSTCAQTFRLPLLGPPVLNEALLGHDFVMKAALSRRRASAYFLTQNSV